MFLTPGSLKDLLPFIERITRGPGRTLVGNALVVNGLLVALVFALGGDESAAARVGFKVRATKFWLYVLVGIIAALAGMVRTCSMGQMHPTNLLGMEMMVIAAVVLGGTAITGGKGSLTGVMLGTLLIVIVQNSMILMGIPTFWQGFALGLLIIVGTGVSALQVMRARRTSH